jgi:predicted alpha/beta-hydrolase family hydrolase
VNLLWDGDPAASTAIVLAPGAGADMRHVYMNHFARGLATGDVRVCRFNFRYAEAGRKSPDKQPVLEETFRSAVEEVRSTEPSKLVLGGKSLGGRIASHIAAGGVACDGLVFLGYPLHAPGRSDRLRDEHLAETDAPMLFVEGTRDPFCPLDTLEAVIARRALDAEIVVIEGGDHSLKLRKSSSERTTNDALDEAVTAVAKWVHKL